LGRARGCGAEEEDEEEEGEGEGGGDLTTFSSVTRREEEGCINVLFFSSETTRRDGKMRKGVGEGKRARERERERERGGRGGTSGWYARVRGHTRETCTWRSGTRKGGRGVREED
jgi:hypothetical protein